jgi:hypothetical protein
MSWKGKGLSCKVRKLVTKALVLFQWEKLRRKKIRYKENGKNSDFNKKEKLGWKRPQRRMLG